MPDAPNATKGFTFAKTAPRFLKRAESRGHDYASCAAGRGLSTGFPSRFSG